MIVLEGEEVVGCGIVLVLGLENDVCDGWRWVGEG